MARNVNSSSKKAGLPPGSLVHVGALKSDETITSLIDYNAETFTEKECETIEECFECKSTSNVSWINIDGLHDTNIIEKLGKHFQMHPLLIEDILNTTRRPKVEEFDNCVLVTIKMLGISEDGKSIISEQVSFVLGDKWLVSFQEVPGDIFDNLRQRIRESKGLIRQHGVDYLLYRLVDTVVDNYFIVAEHFNEVTEALEERVLKSPDQESSQSIQEVKKALRSFRKAVSPLREAIISLQKEHSDFIHAATIRYLRDVYEHVIHVNESIEAQREILASVLDLYHSGISNKMNQVIQVLTIISTIFIPLTFIAGIYGMNFDDMPELHWEHGYLAVWIVMIVLIVLMVIYFRRKKWL